MRSVRCGNAVLRVGRSRCSSLLVSSPAAGNRASSRSSLVLPSVACPTQSLWLSSARRPHSLSCRLISSAAAAPSSSSSSSSHPSSPAADSVSARLRLSPLAGVVECSSSSRPHPDKREGEDTHSLHASPEAVTLAVFDGVGSWSFEQGVDVSLFAKRIKQLTDELLAQSSSPPLPPAALLDAVWARLSGARVRGSCTACIVSLTASPDGCRLDAVTLGDSGFLVLRKRRQGEPETDVTQTVHGDDPTVSVITAYSNSADSTDGDQLQRLQERDHSHSQSSASASSSFPASSRASAAELAYYVHYRSLQQLHYFNCPFQLGFTADAGADSDDSPASASSSSPFDLPGAALPASLSLRAGDVVLLSSDGLFDNLTESAIVRLVAAAGLAEGRQTVAELSASLAAAAFERSVDRRVDGPFAHAAKDHNILWSGGRKDDITVIVAHVAQPAPRQQQH